MRDLVGKLGLALLAAFAFGCSGGCKGGQAAQAGRDAATPLRPPATQPEEGESRHAPSSCMATFEACGGTSDGCKAALAAACRHGTPYWIRHAPGVEAGLGIARVGQDHDVLVTGTFAGQVTFGPGEVNAVTLLSAAEIDEDMFVARYGSDGALHWARRAGGRSADSGVAVAALPDEGALVAGSMLGEAEFGSGERSEATAVATDRRGAIFVARYDRDGLFASVEHAAGPGRERVRGIAVASDGGWLLTGCFNDSITFGSGDAAVTLTAAGIEDIFVAKYGPEGGLAWAKSAGGASEGDCGTAIAAADDGGAFVTGVFMVEATFGAGERGEARLSAVKREDLFVARYDASGALVWAKSDGGPGEDRSTAIAAAPDGSAIVTGYVGVVRDDVPQELTAPAGEPALFFAKYDRAGAQVWRKSDEAGADQGTAVTALGDGSAILVGRFTGTVTLSSSEAAETLEAVADDDLFIARYDAAGELVWANRAGGIGADHGHAVAALEDGSVLLTGSLGTEPVFGTSGATVAVEAGYFVTRLAP